MIAPNLRSCTNACRGGWRTIEGLISCDLRLAEPALSSLRYVFGNDRASGPERVRCHRAGTSHRLASTTMPNPM